MKEAAAFSWLFARARTTIGDLDVVDDVFPTERNIAPSHSEVDWVRPAPPRTIFLGLVFKVRSSE